MNRVKTSVGKISLKGIVQILLLVDLSISLVLIGFMPRNEKSFEHENQITDEIVHLGNYVYTIKRQLQTLSEHTKRFVLTHGSEALNEYIQEGKLLEDSRYDLMKTGSSFQEEEVQYHLLTVQKLIAQMIRDQCYAIALVAQDTYSADMVLQLPDEVVFDSEDAELTPEEKQAKAEKLIFRSEYITLVEQVNKQLGKYNTVLAGNIREKQARGTLKLSKRINEFRILILVSTSTLFITLGLLILLIIRPIYGLIGEIHYSMPAGYKGAYELQFLAGIYNHFREEKGKIQTQLSYEASHDDLTGLYNRGAYSEYMMMYQKRPIALLMVDVDHFKLINDSYGHETGDKVLMRVANVLRRTFRENDVVSRLGGDEFAVIIMDVDKTAQDAIGARIVEAARILEIAEEDMPKITISVGVAFSEQVESGEKLFQAADRALYWIKKNGRNGYGFYTGN